MIDKQTETGIIIGFAFFGLCLLFLLLCYWTAQKHEVAGRVSPPRRRPGQKAPLRAAPGAAPGGRDRVYRAPPGGQGRPISNIPNWGGGGGDGR